MTNTHSTSPRGNGSISLDDLLTRTSDPRKLVDLLLDGAFEPGRLSDHDLHRWTLEVSEMAAEAVHEAEPTLSILCVLFGDEVPDAVFERMSRSCLEATLEEVGEALEAGDRLEVARLLCTAAGLQITADAFTCEGDETHYFAYAIVDGELVRQVVAPRE